MKIKLFTKNINFIIGTLIIGGFFILMCINVFYTPHDVTAMNGPNKLLGPNGELWFGADEFGRDIFSRIRKGTQTAFSVGL